jgi:hypothetical protein
MRLRRALWNAAVIAVWVGGLIGAAALDPDGTLYVVVGVPLTVLAGMLLNRWWAVLVPSILTTIWFTAAYLMNPGCSDCGEDVYGIQIVITLVLFTAPASLALAVGVMARRMGRFFRHLESS